MSDFGYSGRVQTQDGNEGFTSSEVEVHQQRLNTVNASAVDGRSNSLSEGAKTLASSINAMAESVKKEDREASTLSLTLKAKARQGTDIAINEIDSQKRNPLMASVLGQTVTSQVAEAQSMENLATTMANHAYENMSKLAELPEEQALEQLSKYGTELVQEYDDPAIKEKAFGYMQSLMPELAKAHYKERYALKRNEQIENNREHIISQSTLLKNRLIHSSQPEEKLAIIQSYAKNMFNGNDPLGKNQDALSKAEYRNLVLGQVASDLQQGDKTLYDVARMKQDQGQLTPTEREGLKKAEGQYDQHQDLQAENVMNNTTLGLLGAESYGQYLAVAKSARQELATWAIDGTQSEIDKNNQLARKAQLEKMIDAGATEWTKKVATDEHKEVKMNYYSLLSNDDRSVVDAEVGMSKNDYTDAADFQVSREVSLITGMPLEIAQQAKYTMFSEGLTWQDKKGTTIHKNGVEVAAMMSEMLQRQKVDVVPEQLQSAVKNTLTGMVYGSTEKGGKYENTQKESFAAIDYLVTHNAKLFDLTAQEAATLAFYREGIAKNSDVSVVQNQVNTFNMNYGQSDQSGKKDKDVRMDVSNLVTKTLGTAPSDKEMSYHTNEYQRVLKGVGWDHNAAKNIYRDTLLHSTSQALGIPVVNGKALEKQLFVMNNKGKRVDYTLNSLLSYMSSEKYGLKEGKEASLGTPMLMTVFGDLTDKDMVSMTDLNRAWFNKISYTPGDSSVEFASSYGRVTRVPIEEFQNVMNKLEKNKGVKFEVAKTKALMQASGATAVYGGDKVIEKANENPFSSVLQNNLTGLTTINKK